MADWTLITQLLWLFGGAIVAIVLLCVLFIPHFRLGRVEASPDAVLDHISYKLRLARFLVTERHREVIVRSGTFVEVKITSEASENGALVFFQAGMSQTGWAIILVLIWISIFFIGLLAAAIVCGIFLLDFYFIRRNVLSLLTDGTIKSPPARYQEAHATFTGTGDSIKEALVTGLSEGYRLEEDARNADRAQYHDYILITCAGSLVLWTLILASVAFSLGFPLALAIPTAVALAFGIGVGGLLRWKFSPRLKSYALWADRFREYLWRESQEGRPESKDASAFELMEEASREVPLWLHRIHRRATQSNPAVEIAVVVMVVWGFNLTAMALFAAPGGDIVLAAAGGLSGLGLFAGAYLIYSRFVRSQLRKLEQELTEWRKRSEGLRYRMERFLEEL